MLQFIVGIIQTTYATTLTGWHGHKFVGFTLTLNDETHSVNVSAPDAVKQLAKDLLGDSVRIQPKHALTKEFFELEAGVMPDDGDPSRDEKLSDMSKVRHALGVTIWLSNFYIDVMRGNGALCSHMALPPLPGALKCVRYQTMYLEAHGKGITYCINGKFGLERVAEVPVASPYGSRLPFLHFFSDASLQLPKSTTGGIGMLACGCVIAVSQHQHLASPDSHTSEVVAAGTNVNLLVPVLFLLQELRILCGSRVPFYLDSQTTVRVALDDTAVKKSVWLLRRAAVIEDAVVHELIEPLYLSEKDMAADPFTKYLPYAVWVRHMHFVMNYAGDLPPQVK